MIDDSMTGSFPFIPPQDLLAESRRQPKPREDNFRVEGWRTSWFSWIGELFAGRE